MRNTVGTILRHHRATESKCRAGLRSQISFPKQSSPAGSLMPSKLHSQSRSLEQARACWQPKDVKHCPLKLAAYSEPEPAGDLKLSTVLSSSPAGDLMPSKLSCQARRLSALLGLVWAPPGAFLGALVSQGLRVLVSSGLRVFVC